jgi:SAM-dependent methyltransferase
VISDPMPASMDRVSRQEPDMSITLPRTRSRAKRKSVARGQAPVLEIDRRTISDAHRMAGCAQSLLGIIVRHACTSTRLALSGVRYMQQGSMATSASYSRMSTAEFACINGRQAWANWRTIPQNLSGRLPLDRPLRVIDLCCGTGESTQVLAWWLPRGSTIVAYEQDGRFAMSAQSRTYRNRWGHPISVSIRQTSVLETFCDPEGDPYETGSIDIVHAIGSLGCHFSPDESRLIVRECARVLVGGGYAFLDAGRAGTTADRLTSLASEAGFLLEGHSKSWWLDRYVQLALRKPASWQPSFETDSNDSDARIPMWADSQM